MPLFPPLADYRGRWSTYCDKFQDIAVVAIKYWSNGNPTVAYFMPISRNLGELGSLISGYHNFTSHFWWSASICNKIHCILHSTQALALIIFQFVQCFNLFLQRYREFVTAFAVRTCYGSIWCSYIHLHYCTSFSITAVKKISCHDVQAYNSEPWKQISVHVLQTDSNAL